MIVVRKNQFERCFYTFWETRLQRAKQRGKAFKLIQNQNNCHLYVYIKQLCGSRLQNRATFGIRMGFSFDFIRCTNKIINKATAKGVNTHWALLYVLIFGWVYENCTNWWQTKRSKCGIKSAPIFHPLKDAPNEGNKLFQRQSCILRLDARLCDWIRNSKLHNRPMPAIWLLHTQHVAMQFEFRIKKKKTTTNAN